MSNQKLSIYDTKGVIRTPFVIFWLPPWVSSDYPLGYPQTFLEIQKISKNLQDFQRKYKISNYVVFVFSSLHKSYWPLLPSHIFVPVPSQNLEFQRLMSWSVSVFSEFNEDERWLLVLLICLMTLSLNFLSINREDLCKEEKTKTTKLEILYFLWKSCVY
jgi:hypothetical protein